jgi:glutathione S-transferase
MIINEAQCITTTRGIVDYIEATRRTPRLLTPDLSPSPLQVNAVHIVISAIQANLYINPLRPTTLEDRRAWAEVFTGFFDPIHEGQMFLDEEGFSVLDCFFYPATSVYLPLADLDSHKIAVLDYRERVESRTIYAGDPTRNPDNWSDIDGPVIY